MGLKVFLSSNKAYNINMSDTSDSQQHVNFVGLSEDSDSQSEGVIIAEKRELIQPGLKPVQGTRDGK